MIQCPGCGGRNPRGALSCEWCRNSFVQVHRRGLSARWWAALSGGIIVVLLFMVAALALLNATRNAPRVAAITPTPSPPPLLPLQVGSPSPLPVAGLAAVSPVAAPTNPGPPTSPPAAAPTPTPIPPPATATLPPRYARVTNTGGLPANLRREPSPNAGLVAAVPEGSTVRVLPGEQRAADGRAWRQVDDGRGNQGWILADLLVDAPAPPR